MLKKHKVGKRDRQCEFAQPSAAARAAELVSDLRFRRDAAAVHRLGLRASTELFAELVGMAADPALARRRVSRFAGLDPALLRATGADRMPPLPLRAVANEDDDDAA